MSPHNRRSKVDDFIVQGSILAIAIMITKIIGAVYRIPLTRILGDIGNGIYSAAFEVYALALIFSSLSYPIAVSKLVSARVAAGQRRNAYRVFIFALIFSGVVGLISSSLIFLNADFIATAIFGSELSASALRVLAPGLFIVAILGVFRGYFQGMGTMIPTAISQVVEQIFNAVISIVGAIILIGVGVTATQSIRVTGDTIALSYGAAGASLGTVIGALVALLFLLFAYFIYRNTLRRQLRSDRTKRKEGMDRVALVFMMTIIPIMFTTAVYNINNLLDLALFNNIMRAQGYDTDTYIALQGIYTGKYLVLINIPLAMANGLAASLIPGLTSAVAGKDKKAIQGKIGQVLRLTTLIAIPCFVVYAVLASPLMILLFNDPAATPATLLSIGAITVVMYSLATVSNSVLQGLDKIYIPARNAGIALGIHILAVLIMLIVLRWGIYSLVAGNIVFAFTMCFLNLKAIRKYSGYKQDVERIYIKPLIAAIVMGIAAYVIHLLADLAFGGTVIPIIIVIPIAALVYSFLVIKIGTLSKTDMLQLPMGARLLRVAEVSRALPKNFEQ
jgi:stage V sporulation protein B